MSKAATLAGFATSIIPPNDLIVGIVTATSLSVGNQTVSSLGVGISTEGGSVGTGATVLDFRGAGISTVTVSSGIATVNITGGGGGGGASVTTSDTAPVSPSDGDLWYDSVGGRMYVYYDDGDTSQWVDAAPQGGGNAFSAKIEVGNTKAEVTDTGSDGRFVVTTEGTERARVDSSGRLLVGTTDSSGTQLLKVNGSTSGSVYGGTMSLTQGRTPPNGSTLGVLNFGSEANPEGSLIAATAQGAWTAGSSQPSNLLFYTTASGSASLTERMRISANGWINAIQSTTNSLSFGTNTYVFSGDANGWLFQMENTNSVDPYGMRMHFKQASPDNNSSRFLQCHDSTTVRLWIDSDGDVQNHDNSYGGISDIRLKQDITDSGSQWDDIKNIRVRKFRFKSDVEQYGDDAGVRIGVIAQEIETVSPGLVKTSPDLDENNEPTGTDTKTVAYSVLYMKSVKALQEAMERIETLETQNASLEARLTALEGGN